MTRLPDGQETDSFADFEAMMPGRPAPPPRVLADGAWPRPDALESELALVRRAAPVLARLAPAAARALVGAVPVTPGLLLDDEASDSEAWLEPEAEAEDEAEDQPEADGMPPAAEDELGALAEAMLAEAGRAASDVEAAALAGGITIVIVGPAPLLVRRLAPVLSRGTTLLVRALRARPETRPLVPVVGTIARRTARVLTRGAATGRPPTPAIAARVMAGQTRRVLGRPQLIARALNRHAAVRRQALRPRRP